MYLAILEIAAEFPESYLEALGPGLDDLNCGYFASRKIEDDDSTVWLMRWITEDVPDLSLFTQLLQNWCQTNNIPLSLKETDWVYEEIDPDKDWLAESYKGFQPFSVSEFYIYGSHYEGDLPTDQILLQIDAATAFGSGEHPTTAGCLETLHEMKQDGFTPRNILDMGCGSGILAIAAKKLWPDAAVIGIDIEEEAIEVTRRHVTMNDLADDALLCEAGDGFKSPLAQKHAPYDLIIANILAGPLKSMAGDLEKVLAKSGLVILSGLLVEQAGDVTSAYHNENISLDSQRDIKEWTTLKLSR